MFKRLTCLLLLSVLLGGGFRTLAQKQGQAAVDSMLIDLKKSTEDTNKVKLLKYLSYQYSNIDPAEGIKYGEMSLVLATKLNWKKGIAYANVNIAVNYLNQSDFPKALELNKRALALFEQEADKRGLSVVLNNIGMVLLNKSDYNEAANYFERSSKIAEEMGDIDGQAYEIGNLAIVYNAKSDYAKAQE